MKPDYSDILKRIEEKPKWYDKNGTPRYSELHPDSVPNIYADSVIFYIVRCQECGKEFIVENDRESGGEMKSFSNRFESGNFSIGYGDPPRHGCIGDTMNAIPIKIISVWERNNEGKWIKNEKWNGYEFDINV